MNKTIEYRKIIDMLLENGANPCHKAKSGMSVRELTDEKKSKIYYYDTKIADSLEDFLIKMSENIMYYNDII